MAYPDWDANLLVVAATLAAVAGAPLPADRPIDGVDQRIKGYGSNPLGGFMGYMFAEQVWLDA
mgnify:CR=1 FL=1